jgi:hypothetical protein
MPIPASIDKAKTVPPRDPVTYDQWWVRQVHMEAADERTGTVTVTVALCRILPDGKVEFDPNAAAQSFTINDLFGAAKDDPSIKAAMDGIVALAGKIGRKMSIL